MNLLVKKFLSRNILKPGFMLLIPVFFGCETQSDLGIRYDLGSDASVKFIEFTLPATNIYLDSLRTDGERSILVGNFEDQLTGSIEAEGYFSLTYESGPLPRSSSDDSDTLKLDSLVILLESNSIITESIDSIINFSLFQLENELPNGAIFLSSTKQDTINKIGAFKKSKSLKDRIFFRSKLDSAFSQLFFNRLSSIGGDINQSIFAATFQPLGLISEETSSSIASINLASDTSRIILYSSPVDPNVKDTTYLTSFEFINSANTLEHYTYLSRDRSMSEFASISEKENFDLASGKTLIDPLAGISTAITITEIEEFFEQNENFIINNAILSLEFSSDARRDTLVTFACFLRKPDNGIFGPSVESDPFGNIVMTDNGYLTLSSNPAQGSLSEDKSQINISSTLFYEQLHQQFIKGDSLVFLNATNGDLKSIDDLVLVSSVDVSLSRTTFKKDGIKLRIYYTEVDK